MAPRVSFIVSAYDRPEHLKLCLQSLVLQTMTDWDAIVMDNAVSPEARMAHWSVCSGARVRYVATPSPHNVSCYHSADYAVQHIAKGEWLCFPSDDSYYVPQFAERMLAAADAGGWQLVYSNLVWGRQGIHTQLDCKPQLCCIDKTNFMIRRDKMIPFPGKQNGPCCADGHLIDVLVADGIVVGKVDQLLVVHN